MTIDEAKAILTASISSETQFVVTRDLPAAIEIILAALDAAVVIGAGKVWDENTRLAGAYYAPQSMPEIEAEILKEVQEHILKSNS